jgi:tRNA pseudouridine synthase 10
MKQPNLNPLLKKAEKLLADYSSFSISTKIPKEWLAQEEADFDRKIRGAESIKNSLNKKIAQILEEKTGASYDREGDVRIVFDFRGEKPTVSTQFIPVFIFGRYKKLVPGLSQSRWICNSCNGAGCKKCDNKGKFYESVEERIGDVVGKHFEATDYSMHASGREDVDATNTAGRPFVIEIVEPKKRKADLKKIVKEIAKGAEVSVADLKIVPRSYVEVVTESHFDKEYEAVVEFEKEVGRKELKKIEALEGVVLSQRTPTRVSHRRADKVRERKVLELKIIKTLDSRPTEAGASVVHGTKRRSVGRMTFLIKAEAGTYIKELISSDGKRTTPSFSEVLGFGAKCTGLAVTKIEDGFLDTVK